MGQSRTGRRARSGGRIGLSLGLVLSLLLSGGLVATRGIPTPTHFGAGSDDLAHPVPPTSSVGISRAAVELPPAVVRPSASNATSVQWFDLSSKSRAVPEARDRQAECYDEDAHLVVMFGGYDPTGNGWLGDSWTYQAGTWTMLHPSTAPAARSSAMMTYDPNLGGCLLFGGFYLPSGTFYSDTWLCSDGVWSEIFPTSSPPGRSEGNLVYDPRVGGTILFGGTNGTDVFNDTWEYAGGDWIPVTSPVAPAARSAATMAYDNASASLVLSGGYNGSEVFNDTWTFAGVSWTNDTTGTSRLPAQIYGESTTLPNGTVMTTTNGNDNFGYLETWIFTKGNWSQITESTEPYPRDAGTLVTDFADGYVLMFGGTDPASSVLSQTWALDMSHLELLRFNTTGLAPFTFQPNATESFGATPIAPLLWSFGDFVGSSGVGASPTHVYSTAGTFPVAVTSEDALHLGVKISTTVTVTMPIVVTANPASGDAPLAITFGALASNGSGPYTVSWEYGDGMVGQGTSPTHTYGRGGPFVVNATVKDGSGATGVGSTTVQLNAPLTVTAIAAPSSGPGPLRVTFTGTATGGVEPYTYSWNLGDGNTALGPSASHTYVLTGTFAVSVKVADSLGRTANASIQEDVQGGTPSGTGPSSGSFLGLGTTLWILIVVVAAVAVAGLALGWRRRGRAPPGNAPETESAT